MQSLIVLLSFLTVTALVVWIYLVLTAQQRLMGQRVEAYTTQLDQVSSDRHQKSRRSMTAKGMFQQASKVFAAKSYTKTIELELGKADIPLRGEEFILINLLVAVGPALMILVITRNLPLAVVLAGIGFVVPRMLVSRAKKNRVAKFNSQIGDALVVMSNSLRAGFSFLQAMEMVGKEMQPPVADEFVRTLREMNLGTPTEEALSHLTKRIDSDDLDLVVTAVMIQRQVGGNLAEVLESISYTIRERIRIKGEIKTLTSHGRMSGLVIGALPVVVALILSVLNPEYTNKLFTTSVGMAITVAGVISQVIGIVVINKIVDIEV